MRELLLEIWTSVRRNKLRTFLTGFSVAWGIFMLVILLGSGNGLKNGVTSNFGNYATNSINLYGGRTSKPYMGYQKGRRIRLWNSDLEILAREFPEVDEVAANSWFDNHTATYGNEYTKVWLRGSLPKIEQIEGVEIVKGRFVNDADIREYRKSLVIDQAMQSLLFKGADPLGARIKLDSTVFTVVGVYKGDAQRSSSSCYIPLTTGQLLYNANSPEVNNAIITIKGVHTTEAMKEFEKRVIRRLSAEHHFAPDDESAIWLDNTMETYKNFMMVFAGINIFVWIIGADLRQHLLCAVLVHRQDGRRDFRYRFDAEFVIGVAHGDHLPVGQAGRDAEEGRRYVGQVGDIVGVLAARFVLAALVGLLYGLANRCVVDFLDHCLMYLPIYLL